LNTYLQYELQELFLGYAFTHFVEHWDACGVMLEFDVEKSFHALQGET